MPELNPALLGRYSEKLTDRLLRDFFVDKTHISGKEILNFSEIQQVNLLVIKHLFDKWQAEASRLESPYFDYTHTAVKTALSAFMNILSQHIRVSRADFHPLLLQAIYDTLCLVVQPQVFYRHEMERVHTISAGYFKQIGKYLQYNKEFLKALIIRLDRKETWGLDDAQRTLEQVYTENSQYIEPTEWRLRAFQEILPFPSESSLDKEDVLFLDSGHTTAMEITHEESLTAESPIATGIFSPSKPILATPHEDDEIADLPDTLHARLRAEQESSATVLDSFHNTKLTDLRNAMSLNQKFLYANHLFKGDTLAFNEAIDRIENMQSYGEAYKFLLENYALRQDWNFETEEVRSFLDLVARRFEE